MDQPVFSLLQVMQSVRRTLSARYTSSFWVRAEMNKLNHYSHSGHCYPELVEKQDGKVIAQVNATLWKEDYRRADALFRDTLNEPLRDGIKILFRAKIGFEPVHGLSLNILEIDPAFTLGDLEREKKETLEKLRLRGLENSNKALSMPVLPQRIAVISVETSKGYADFLSVIDNNPFGYRFFHMLFPSILQGEKAVDGITRQLRNIRKVIAHFDVVAIIRGGGGDVGLSVYNDYRIAEAIASFPIPVLSGIGHATNLTASEMVSHSFAITPTKLAETLLQRFHETAVPLGRASRTIGMQASAMIESRKQRLSGEAKLFRSATSNRLAASQNAIGNLQAATVRSATALLEMDRNSLTDYQAAITTGTFFVIAENRNSVSHLKLSVQRDTSRLTLRASENLAFAAGQIGAMDPANVLRRGYSITRFQGIAVRDPNEIPEGAEITTELSAGSITSRKTS